MPEVKLELFTLKQRVFLVKHFYQSLGDCRLVKSDYEAFYGASQTSRGSRDFQISEGTITALIDLFENTGSVLKTFQASQGSQENDQRWMRNENPEPAEMQEEEMIEGKAASEDYEDPLEDLDSFGQKENEEIEEESENQDVKECFKLPIIKQEIDFYDEIQENDDEDSQIEGQSFTDDNPEVIPKLETDIDEQTTAEENVEYRDDNTQEVPEADESGKQTCPTCEKKCKTLKGHKCFLLACIYCRMKFPRKNLQNHMNRNHRNKKLFKCEFCEKFFLRRDDLESHRRTHTKEKPYACRVEGCSERFQWRQALRRHKMTAHIRESNGVFNCTSCPATYHIREHLVMHIKRWHDLRVNNSSLEATIAHPESEESQPKEQKKRIKACPHCHESYSSSTEHKCLQGMAGAGLNEEERLLRSKDRPFVCSFRGCGKAFCWNQSLRRHQHTHRNDGNRFKCEFCHYFSYSKELLERHLAKIHKMPSNEAPGMYPSTSRELQGFSGEELQESRGDVQEINSSTIRDMNAWEFQLSGNQRNEHTELITCEYCQENFSKGEFLQHVEMEHRRRMKHICRVCGKEFRRLQNLQNHQKEHIQQENHQKAQKGLKEKQKIFTCRTCGKTCARKYDLKSHEKVHTDERPYLQ
uniref:Putative c2h2-type zn-finger protein n=1 Tax=Lutzomyia longipalpis TaxID=7200 RepID=A0A1B0CL43_LUTLO